MPTYPEENVATEKSGQSAPSPQVSLATKAGLVAVCASAEPLARRRAGLLLRCCDKTILVLPRSIWFSVRKEAHGQVRQLWVGYDASPGAEFHCLKVTLEAVHDNPWSSLALLQVENTEIVPLDVEDLFPAGAAVDEDCLLGAAPGILPCSLPEVKAKAAGCEGWARVGLVSHLPNEEVARLEGAVVFRQGQVIGIVTAVSEAPILAVACAEILAALARQVARSMPFHRVFRFGIACLLVEAIVGWVKTLVPEGPPRRLLDFAQPPWLRTVFAPTLLLAWIAVVAASLGAIWLGYGAVDWTEGSSTQEVTRAGALIMGELFSFSLFTLLLGDLRSGLLGPIAGVVAGLVARFVPIGSDSELATIAGAAVGGAMVGLSGFVALSRRPVEWHLEEKQPLRQAFSTLSFLALALLSGVVLWAAWRVAQLPVSSGPWHSFFARFVSGTPEDRNLAELVGGAIGSLVILGASIALLPRDFHIENFLGGVRRIPWAMLAKVLMLATPVLAALILWAAKFGGKRGLDEGTGIGLLTGSVLALILSLLLSLPWRTFLARTLVALLPACVLSAVIRNGAFPKLGFPRLLEGFGFATAGVMVLCAFGWGEIARRRGRASTQQPQPEEANK